MNKKLPIALALLAGTLGLSVWVAQAADFACGQYTCVAAIEWDGPHGWTVATHPNTGGGADLSVLEQHSFGFVFPSTARGVLRVGPGVRSVGINATTWDVPPGTYRLVTRMGSEKDLWSAGQNITVTAIDAARSQTALGTWLVRDEFVEYISAPFTITVAGPVTFAFEGDARKPFYLDFIWVTRVQTGPGTPTATPLPATATPAPTATPYCYTPPATPPIPPFGATATPTPDPASDWFVFSDFNGSSLPAGWSQTGTGSITVAFGAAYIPASTAGNRVGLTYQRAYNSPFYVSGRASAQFVPAGRTMRLEIWVYDGAWSQATNFIISSGRDYPFYAQINAPNVTAVSFSGRMDDESTAYGISLAYVWIFGRRERGPICGASGQPVDPIKAPPLQGAPPDANAITWPLDKPCPSPVLQEPNNFWGPILTQVTLFLDGLFAFSPAYQSGQLMQMADALFRGPAGLYASIYGTMIDLRFVITMAGIVLASELVRGFWSIWMFLKRTIPFLGGG